MSRVHERSGPPLPDAGALAAPLTTIFTAAARERPDEPFLLSLSLPEESCDFAHFDEEARRVAASLVAGGLRPGERVALLSENRPRWCLAYVAILHAGGVVVPIDAQLGPAAIAAVLADAGASALFLSAELSRHAGALRERGFAGALHALDGPDWEALASGAEAALPEAAGGERQAAILYTSGTTGSPKGVVLTHRNVQALVRSVALALEFRPDDRLIMFLPLHHVLSQVGSFLLPAALRLRSVHAVIHSGEELLAALREGGVTILLAVPLLFQLVHERIERQLAEASALRRRLYRLSLGACAGLRRAFGWKLGRLIFGRVHALFGPRLRLLASGGSALDTRVQGDFLALGFDLIQAYGLTETTGGIAMQPIGDRSIGSVGDPLPGARIRIDDPDEHGVGEIRASGPMISPGYHARPEATAEIWRDGWLHTGDLGRFRERDGFLEITGRIKDVIVLGSGKNVQPEELEAHYQGSRWIAEICVMGLEHGEQGDRLHGVVVPDWELARREGVTGVREVLQFEIENLSAELPSYQRLLSFEVRREPLPRTATRKLQRFLVQPASASDEAAATPTPDDEDQAARLDSEAGRLVAELIRRRLEPGHPLRARSSFELDLGLDSLNRMELLLSVEQALGIAFTDEEAAVLHSVDELLVLADKKLAAGEAAMSARPGGWRELVADAGPADLPPALRERRGLLSQLVLQLLVGFGATVLKLLFRMRAEGLEHLRIKGPFLLCPNHVSYLDPFLVSCYLPARVVGHCISLAEADYVSQGFAGFMARFLGIVPTNPNLHLRLAMRAGAAGLKQGRMLLIFPEGTRSAGGALQELKQGAAILATELDLPIVPAVIEGAYEAWPRSASRPRWFTPCRIRYGAPLRPAEWRRGLEGEAAYREVTEGLRRRLVELGAPAPESP